MIKIEVVAKNIKNRRDRYSRSNSGRQLEIMVSLPARSNWWPRTADSKSPQDLYVAKSMEESTGSRTCVLLRFAEKTEVTIKPWAHV